jgi:hypothetical protein
VEAKLSHRNGDSLTKEMCMDSRKQSEAQVITRAQQDSAFRQELLSDPKGVIAREMGVTLPDSVNVEVVEETASKVYLVLPPQAASTGSQLSDAELENVAGGWSIDVSTQCTTRDPNTQC